MSRAQQFKSSPGCMEKGINLPTQRHQSPWKCSSTCEMPHPGPIGDTGYPGATEEARQDTQQHLRRLEMPEAFPTSWQGRPVWNRSPWQWNWDGTRNDLPAVKLRWAICNQGVTKMLHVRQFCFWLRLFLNAATATRFIFTTPKPEEQELFNSYSQRIRNLPGDFSFVLHCSLWSRSSTTDPEASRDNPSDWDSCSVRFLLAWLYREQKGTCTPISRLGIDLPRVLT